MNRLWKTALALVAVLGLATLAVGFVSAQTDGSPVPDRLNNFISGLADNLGITQEELEGAIDQTQLDMVDDAVEEGRLDEEKADTLRERIESGEGSAFFGGFRRGHGSGDGSGHFGAFAGGEALAELLGVTTDDLRDALTSGQSLAQVAEANGVSVDELTKFLLAQIEDHTAQAVEDGKIDQAKADEILANAADMIDKMINQEGSFGKFRHGGFKQSDGFKQGGGFPSHGDFSAPTDGSTVEPDTAGLIF